MLIELLQKFGFSEREALIYRASLKIGESSVTKIAVEADLPRTHCYDLLRTLEEKAAVTSVTRNGRYRYTATRPVQLVKIFEERLKSFQERVPAWDLLYQQAPNQPQIRFFTGKDGLTSVHEEFLGEAREILFFGSGEDWMDNFKDYTAFTKKLVHHHIRIREITKETPAAKEYGKLYREGRHEMRFLKPGWIVPSDMMVWDNKVALVTYGGPEMHGVIIESASIAATMRQMFEAMWGICA